MNNSNSDVGYVLVLKKKSEGQYQKDIIIVLMDKSGNQSYKNITFWLRDGEAMVMDLDYKMRRLNPYELSRCRGGEFLVGFYPTREAAETATKFL